MEDYSNSSPSISPQIIYCNYCGHPNDSSRNHCLLCKSKLKLETPDYGSQENHLSSDLMSGLLFLFLGLVFFLFYYYPGFLLLYILSGFFFISGIYFLVRYAKARKNSSKT